MSTVHDMSHLANDCRLIWDLYEDGFHYSTTCANTAAEALEQAKSNVTRANYPDVAGTIWIDVRVVCQQTDEVDMATLTLDPDAPQCAASQVHDWQSPFSVLGGLRENPGVWGNGGGVVIREVCAHCGRYRILNTWAQRPDTGEQGLESLTYADADASSLEWIAEREAA